MKKILALAAVAALTAGVSAYAANPFSDVTADDWAYQAVSDLSAQGVVEGYPDGTFKGERNMTRYELAQIVARLMAKEDQLNAEQQATLDKLAGEYADELANLGVRVSNLEKKVGNLYWSGDARMRYLHNSVKDANGHKDAWDGRMRINVKGQVNDATYVQGQLVTQMDFKGSNSPDTYKDGKKNGDTFMAQLYVNHNFSDKVAVRLGRQQLKMGNQGGWMYAALEGYDGAQVSYNDGKLALTTGFGQLAVSDVLKINNKDMYFAQGAYDFGVAKLNADYIATKESKDNKEIYGVGLNVPVQKFNVFGEYYQNTVAKDYDTAWNAGLSYGKADWKKPGTWDLSVSYNDVDSNVYIGGGVWHTDMLKNNLLNAKNLTFWNALANVTLQKNVQLHAEYAFAADAEKTADPDDAWTVSLNYKF